MIGDTNVRAMPVAAGTQISTLEVGTLVKINLNGTPWEWRIVHQGLPGDMYDASCDGCWLLLENIHSERRWDSTNNDYKNSDINISHWAGLSAPPIPSNNNYKNSDINIWLQSDFLPMLDSGTQGQVKQVKIPYVNGTGSGGSVASGANGLSCKIFLLSGYEVGFSTSDNSYFPRDGAKLSYFSSGTGSAANNKRIAKYNGSATNWWLRSPSTLNTYYVWGVYFNGDYDFWGCSGTYGVRPALILPSTALVDDDLNVLAA